MGTAVTISPYGIPVHEALNGTPVEIATGAGSGMLVRYSYDGTNPANAKRGAGSTPVQTKGGYPGPTIRPDGTYPPAIWSA